MTPRRTLSACAHGGRTSSAPRRAAVDAAHHGQRCCRPRRPVGNVSARVYHGTATGVATAEPKLGAPARLTATPRSGPRPERLAARGRRACRWPPAGGGAFQRGGEKRVTGPRRWLTICGRLNRARFSRFAICGDSATAAGCGVLSVEAVSDTETGIHHAKTRSADPRPPSGRPERPERPHSGAQQARRTARTARNGRIRRPIPGLAGRYLGRLGSGNAFSRPATGLFGASVGPNRPDLVAAVIDGSAFRRSACLQGFGPRRQTSREQARRSPAGSTSRGVNALTANPIQPGAASAAHHFAQPGSGVLREPPDRPRTGRTAPNRHKQT